MQVAVVVTCIFYKKTINDKKIKPEHDIIKYAPIACTFLTKGTRNEKNM